MGGLVLAVAAERAKQIWSKSCATRILIGAALVLVATSCSVGSNGATTTTKPARPAATATYRRPACHLPAPTHPIQAVQVPGVANGWTVTSFDGTKLRAYWFPVSSSGGRR